MRILHISWEYPPLVYGGLGRHVHALAQEQARQGHAVTVLTQTPAVHEPAATQKVNGVTVHRVPRDPPHVEFTAETMLAWVDGLQSALGRAVGPLCERFGPDVIHAHDWMTAGPATMAQTACQRPLITTIHATEAGRHQGWLPGSTARTVHHREWFLTNSSTKVITCSGVMRAEVQRLFDLSTERVDVVPNGIDLNAWTVAQQAVDEARRDYARGGPTLVYSGRLEWEKGVHVLLEAMAPVLAEHPRARLVVAGKGSRSRALADLAQRLELGAHALFCGWLPQEELHGLVAAADVCVVPSLYEPFGLVALEAAALGTPVVVSDTGGLAEFADDDTAALTFRRGDAGALATTLLEVLSEPVGAAQRSARALVSLSDRYAWPQVAGAVIDTYRVAGDGWTGPLGPVGPAPEPGEGNLLGIEGL